MLILLGTNMRKDGIAQSINIPASLIVSTSFPRSSELLIDTSALAGNQLTGAMPW